MVPTQIKVNEKIFYVKWNDDSETEIQLANLRRFCPCAICTSQEEAHHHDYIKVFTPEQLMINSVNMVGNYAVAVRWADNHNTGIYEFSYLKRISDL
ncbi:MAG: hypothetical protein C0408_10035 [Odoribacter sp.]|nr:hypothetical protein [Odoribacter sp.]